MAPIRDRRTTPGRVVPDVPFYFHFPSTIRETLPYSGEMVRRYDMIRYLHMHIHKASIIWWEDPFSPFSSFSVFFFWQPPLTNQSDCNSITKITNRTVIYALHPILNPKRNKHSEGQDNPQLFHHQPQSLNSRLEPAAPNWISAPNLCPTTENQKSCPLTYLNNHLSAPPSVICQSPLRSAPKNNLSPAQNPKPSSISDSPPPRPIFI